MTGAEKRRLERGQLGAREGHAGAESQEAESWVLSPCFHVNPVFWLQVLEWQRFPCKVEGKPVGPARPRRASMAVLRSLGSSLVESFPLSQLVNNHGALARRCGTGPQASLALDMYETVNS